MGAARSIVRANQFGNSVPEQIRVIYVRELIGGFREGRLQRRLEAATLSAQQNAPEELLRRDDVREEGPGRPSRVSCASWVEWQRTAHRDKIC